VAMHPLPPAPAMIPPVDFTTGPALLAKHTELLLGPRGPGSVVRIMVTMPSEAATEYTLVRDLVAAGMEVMRINGAHDSRATWQAMADNFRRAQQELQRPGRILFDLSGPKLRTGALEEGARVVHWRPDRDERGRVIAPARIWLTPAARPSPPPLPADAILPIEGALLTKIGKDDSLEVIDSREKRRTLTVTSQAGESCWAECTQTAYVETGACVRLSSPHEKKDTGCVGALPPQEVPIVVHVGDTLLLVPDTQKGRDAQRQDDGTVREPASIPCSRLEVFRDARVGDRIFFDEGKLGGIIRRVESELLEVTITHARRGGEKLRADKGINLPDTTLNVPALTEKDLQDLDFAATAADIVGLSFVRLPDEVHRLRQELMLRNAHRIGIILKIETRLAFENLPHLLLAGLCAPPLGVMVARGDLAVELGFERMAEVQEEILWLCEAAHIPVVWATQVLESLAKKGIPSRAEVTDAAMSSRAECVMLNKGPYLVEAVQFLDGVLRRMEDHQQKKRALLRKLAVSTSA